jgi:hypothetical protein
VRRRDETCNWEARRWWNERLSLDPLCSCLYVPLYRRSACFCHYTLCIIWHVGLPEWTAPLSAFNLQTRPSQNRACLLVTPSSLRQSDIQALLALALFHTHHFASTCIYKRLSPGWAMFRMFCFKTIYTRESILPRTHALLYSTMLYASSPRRGTNRTTKVPTFTTA